jgi:GNAT superfamily N-acetyltransferase
MQTATLNHMHQFIVQAVAPFLDQLRAHFRRLESSQLHSARELSEAAAAAARPHLGTAVKLVACLDVLLLFRLVRSRKLRLARRAAPPSLSIRPPRPEDLAKFQQMWACYCEDWDADHALAERVFRELGEQQGLLIAQLDGQVAGFATFIVIPHTFGRAMYLEDLFVDARARGAGVGTALIAHVKQAAQRAHLKRLYWHTQRTNLPARSLYGSLAQLVDHVKYQVNFA